MEKLGVQPSLLLAQIVNFLIILFVLTKLLYKPILSMLEKRKKEIEEGLRYTEKMRQEEEKFNEKRQKMLEEAKKEGRMLIEEAKKEAQEQAREAVEEGRREAGEIIEKGKGEAQHIKEEVTLELKKEALKMAVVMTERLLSQVMTKELQHTVIEKHMRVLSSKEITKKIS